MTVLTGLEELHARFGDVRDLTLVGGAFDLLHVGHVRLLEYAKGLGGTLIVAVLDDNYVQSYKGPDRPIIPQGYRCQMVASLKAVDFAFVSLNSGYDFRTLEVLRPARLVFGTEPDREERVQQRIGDIVRDFPHIEIVRLDRFADPTMSTSSICKRIAERESPS